MNQTAVINKENRDNRLMGNHDLKEEIRMSLVNMAMNIGIFNINISITKDKERRHEMLFRKAEYNKRIKEVFENRNNTINEWQMHNIII